MRTKRRGCPLLLGALCVAAACGGPRSEDAGEADAASGDTAAATAPVGAADTGEATGADEAPAGPGDTASAGATTLPPLAGEGEPRRYRLLIVNRGVEAIHVHASAGAGRVVLDTIPGRDSARVDIRVRADRIRLEAEDAAGIPVARIELDLRSAGLNRWEVPASGS